MLKGDVERGEKKRGYEFCDRDYKRYEAAAYHLPDCVGSITGRECDSGGNVVYQVTKLREWAAVLSAAYSAL